MARVYPLFSSSKGNAAFIGNEKGGILISHDYYTESYSGVAQAIDEYVGEHPQLRRIPVGDGLSVMLIGF